MNLDDSQWAWIMQNLHADTAALRLRRDARIPSLAIEQIEARQSASAKLSDTLARSEHFLFPYALLAQQCTSDAIARYHATLVAESEHRILDMTGGLGIDAFHIASAPGKQLHLCEIDPAAASALSINARSLNLNNIDITHGDSVDYLQSLPDNSFDLIFIDPARRQSTHGKRLRSLSDCSPDVVAIWPQMLRVAPRIIVKASPMLDITATQQLLPCMQSLTAVGHKRSVSELVLELRREVDESQRAVKAVTLDNRGDILSAVDFNWAPAPHASASQYAHVEKGMIWIEPFAPLMKVGRFDELGRLYDLPGLSRNAHIYLASDPASATSFPGITYQVERVVEANKKNFKRIGAEYASHGADVAVRDYPLAAEALRSLMGISRGGSTRIVACKDSASRKLLVILRASS